MGQQTFEFLLLTMSALAVVVFVALYYVRAGYGMFHTPPVGSFREQQIGLDTDGSTGIPCYAIPVVEQRRAF